MHEGRKHLEKVLTELVAEGALTSDQTHLIEERFDSMRDSESKQSVFAEIAAYLGGAFVLIALASIASQRWDDASSLTKFLALSGTSVLLLGIAIWFNGRTAMLLRLTSVLAMTSALLMTAAVAIVYQSNEAPWLAFSSGAVIAVSMFVKYRHEILHIGAYGYLFLTGFMILGKFIGSEPDQNPIYPLYWVALSAVWIYFSYSKRVDSMLGYLMSIGSLFLGIQFLYFSNHQVISYSVSIAGTTAAVLIFLKDRRWPLLVGAVAMTTFTVGEFVGDTLGGSLGALIGLLAAGIALITTSLLAIKKLR